MKKNPHIIEIQNLFRIEHLQEKIDIFKAASVTLHYHHLQRQMEKFGPASVFSDDFPLAATQQALKRMDFESHREIVDSHIREQLFRMFSMAHNQARERGHEIIPYPPRRRINGAIQSLERELSFSSSSLHYSPSSPRSHPNSHTFLGDAVNQTAAPYFRPQGIQDRKPARGMDENDQDLEIYSYSHRSKDKGSHLEISDPPTLSGPQGSWPQCYSHPDGYSLEISESSITHPAAGDGLFVRGHCPPGSIICIYPGTVYSRPQLVKRPEIIDGNEYMIGRYDSFVVDGRDWAKRAWALHHAFLAGLSIPVAQLKKFSNPFGVGQFINHPPKDVKPNVASMSWDFAHTKRGNDKTNHVLSEELQMYIPNETSQTDEVKFFNNEPRPLTRSVILIALRHIQNEELYLNYRFNPRAKYPEWYHQPDLAAAERRWQKPSWFGMQI